MINETEKSALCSKVGAKRKKKYSYLPAGMRIDTKKHGVDRQMLQETEH
jgi:hypothetical protein